MRKILQGRELARTHPGPLPPEGEGGVPDPSSRYFSAASAFFASSWPGKAVAARGASPPAATGMMTCAYDLGGLETLDLLSTPGLLKSVRLARREIARGETFSLDEVLGAR